MGLRHDLDVNACEEDDAASLHMCVRVCVWTVVVVASVAVRPLCCPGGQSDNNSPPSQKHIARGLTHNTPFTINNLHTPT